MSLALVLRLAMNATARFCAKSSTLLSSQARLFASKACFVAPLGLAFTMAGDGQVAPIFGLIARRIAFTMAEILLSLTIIGVVAAITLPSLTGNINERTWNTQRKALYARISQAVALLPNVNSYGSPDNWEDTATESFLTAGLSKVLKINNICDNEHLSDCGFPSKIIPYSGSKITSIPRTMYEWHDGVSCSEKSVNIPNTKAAAFETANGESVLAYYNPRCLNLINYADTWSNAFYKRICVNLIYDLNGKRGPNVMGKDIGFITIMNPTDPIVVAPRIYNGVVQAKGIELANQKCREKFGEVSRIPNDYEMTALTINGKLIGYQNLNYSFWISDILRTLDDGRKSYYIQYMNDGTGAPGRRWEQLGTANGTCLCIIKD